MRPSISTIMAMVCLLLGVVAQPVYAQRSGVPALGYYRPCVLSPSIARAQIIQPEFQKTEIVRPVIEAPKILSPEIAHAFIVPTEFEKPNMVRPLYLDPCLDGSAAFSAALIKSSAVLGMKFDRNGHVVTRGLTNDTVVAAMLMPPKVAAKMLAHQPEGGSQGRGASVPAARDAAPMTVNTSCCGEVPVEHHSDGIRVRTRQ